MHINLDCICRLLCFHFNNARQYFKYCQVLVVNTFETVQFLRTQFLFESSRYNILYTKLFLHKHIFSSTDLYNNHLIRECSDLITNNCDDFELWRNYCLYLQYNCCDFQIGWFYCLYLQWNCDYFIAYKYAILMILPLIFASQNVEWALKFGFHINMYVLNSKKIEWRLFEFRWLCHDVIIYNGTCIITHW
jgi:hypothetical protein